MEEPKDVPPVSTAPSTMMARPIGQRFEIGPTDTNPAGGTVGRGAGHVGNGDDAGIAVKPLTLAENEEEPAPPVKKVEVPKVISKGVITGEALSLPKPAYPAPAQAVGASGQVSVQVLIDESGHVVSAHAVGGHPLLRASAERAALSARFTPTKLSEVPVKVMGIITYNFVRS
jgi:TonB family protein